MKRHPDDGVLRRLVDEPPGVADTDREHVATCPVCAEGLATARSDAAFAADALHIDADPDVDAAWHRLASAKPGRSPRKAPRHWRSPIIAGAAAVVLLAGAGAAAAGDWFQIFKTERIAPVTVHQADLMAMPDLSSWGDVEITSRPKIHPVANAAAAEKESGLDLPGVAVLPRGVTGDPSYQAGRRISASFTFRAAKVMAFAEKQGETPPPMPAGLDGSSFRLTAGPGAAAVWSSKQDVPSLIVARAVAPTAYSTGVPFATARDYLLSLSGLPADVAKQLRTFTADGTTLPLHVMPEEMTSRSVDVGGAPATLLTSSDGVLSAVLWVRDGVVTAVAGSLSADEVLTVARGLR
jgi:anti-sigma factor RsiW